MKNDTICFKCGLKKIVQGNLYFRPSLLMKNEFKFEPEKLTKCFKEFSYQGFIVDKNAKCCVSCGLIWTKLNCIEEVQTMLEDNGNFQYFICLNCSSAKMIKGRISIYQEENKTYNIRFSTENYRKKIVMGRPLLNEFVTGCINCGLIFGSITPITLFKFILKYCKTDFIISYYPYEENKNQFSTFLDDDESDIRKSVVKILGLIGDKRSMPSLILKLNDDAKEVRKSAINSLNSISPSWIDNHEAKNQIPKFIWALKNGKSGDRLVAAEALGLFEGNDITEALINYAIGDKSRKVRYASIKSLRQILPEDDDLYKFSPDLYCAKCLRRSKKIVRKFGLFKKAVFVYCPKCYETKHLAKGIKTVVGEIGGSRKEIDAKGDKAIVSLWDESGKTAFPADVDLIMVRNNGIKNIHRALNSVILELKSIEGKQEDWVRQTPVKFERGLSLTKLETNMINDNFEDVAFDFEPDL